MHTFVRHSSARAIALLVVLTVITGRRSTRPS